MLYGLSWHSNNVRPWELLAAFFITNRERALTNRANDNWGTERISSFIPKVTAGKTATFLTSKPKTTMKTTLRDGTQIYEDSDLDDEIIPGNGKLIIPHLIVCVVIALVIVLGVAAIFCI
jgi:hypothetical protein